MGRAAIWGTGPYRQVVKDKDNQLIWDGIVSEVGSDLSIFTGPSGSENVGHQGGNYADPRRPCGRRFGHDAQIAALQGALSFPTLQDATTPTNASDLFVISQAA